MNRRLFFKNMFGAAMVAAIPKPIFDTIASLPEPKQPVKPSTNKDKQGLWVFDMDDHFITRSQDFELILELPTIDRSYNYEEGFIVKKYHSALPTFKVIAKKIEKPVSNYEFSLGKEYKAVIIKEDTKIYGNFYMTNLIFIDDLTDYPYEEVIFQGTGELTIITS